VPPAKSTPPPASRSLTDGRDAIAPIDGAIVRLIAERVQAARSVAVAKRHADLPILDHAQEARVVRRAAEMARAEGLPEEDVRTVFWRLIALTRESEARAS
jgi:chorismate mutase